MELLDSIQAGDVPQLRSVLQNNPKWTVKSRHGRDDFSLLHWGCHFGALEVVQWLLWNGADSHVTSKYGWTCGHIAALRGHSACLEALAIYKCDLSAMDDKGCSALHLSAAHGKTSCVDMLLRHGVDFRATDMKGWTAVHHAAYHGSLRALISLKRFGASLQEPDVDGNSPAHLAAREGQLPCLQTCVVAQDMITSALETRNDEGDTPKTLALHYQKEDCIRYLTEFEKIAKIPDFYSKHDYPAHAAAYHGNLQLLSTLIEDGHCGINDQDVWGCTPAHKAAGGGHIECLQWLIDNSADVHIRSKSGEMPIDAARKFAKLDCLAVLGGEDDSQLEESGEVAESVPDHMAKGRALKRVEDLLGTLTIAKGHLKQLGGVSQDDVDRELEMQEHKSVVDKLLGDLERERIRREELEMQVDRLRLKLHQSEEKAQQLEELLRHKHLQKRSGEAPGDQYASGRGLKPTSASQRGKPNLPDLNRGAYLKITKKTTLST